ncbi:PrsW family glutamic-type intramembrane protease [Nocardiopsis halophila]|uniref:PrsW family glutamic-type intramembrane protease n=1 Tax=Nocardiopsis halophila TaxID=141692 RepID=UPI000346E7DA|nr:PrsW family glutamic-type intramembrane protease [Nocardiopsis halophila]
MDVQPMLTRDLVLRVCANSTEFATAWTDDERKVVAPFLAPRDTALIDAVVRGAAAMGVERILVCRTRAEYAYEPVTDAPATSAAVVEVIRGWGDDPTDLLLAVEDLSAAVLVTADELTVAAGPDAFVRAVVGADVPGVRAGFAEEAQDRRDPDLMRSAQRYGCLETGGRHARTSRSPGPDLAERLSERARSLREHAPGTARALRAVRGGACWALLVVLALAALFSPGVSAAVPAAFGVLWLLVQLAVPARSRTVGFATLVRIVPLGALMLWPIAFVQQVLAQALGPEAMGAGAGVYIAVYTEELGKLLPLLALWPVARRRFRRLAAVDYLLLGAASGAGFHLAEQGLAALASQGAVVGGAEHRLFTLLPGWTQMLPDGPVFPGHGVLTALVTGAFGLAVVGRRHYGAWLWLLPAAAVGTAAVVHTRYNAAVEGLAVDPVGSFLAALTGDGALVRWLLLALLVAGVLLDHRLARPTADTTPPLPGAEPLAGLTRAVRGRQVRARVRVPGDIAPVFRRSALAAIRFPVTAATALAAMAHEVAVQVRAARTGPSALFDCWRFLRHRRAHAMGAARAAGRPWRPYPSHARLDAARRRLESGAPAIGATAVVGTAAAAAAALPVSPPAGAGPEGAAYALPVLQAAIETLSSASGAEAAWSLAGAAALLALAVGGWSVPWSPPAARTLLRSPGRAALEIAGMAAPGQLPYAAAGLASLLLPRRPEGR